MDLKMSLVFLISASRLFQVQGTKSFKLKVHEKGVDFEEDLRFEGNIQIVDVPAHHDRLATQYVKDLSKKLQLQVVWLEEECLVSKILFPVESEVQIEALEAQELIPVNYENATHVDILQIEGPEMEHSEIPHSLRSYCPEHFTAKAVHSIDERNIVEENDGGILIKDPEINNDALNNAPAPHVSDTLHFLSRKKRDVCKDAYGRTIERCHTIKLECPVEGLGCPALDIYYKCVVAGTVSCEYVLTCNRAGGPNSVQCLQHMTNTARKCRPCCRFLDCGANMRRCSSDPECFQKEEVYEGYDVKRGRTYWVNSALKCQLKCKRKTGCNHFSFIPVEGEDEGECFLQTQKGNRVSMPDCNGCQNGPKVCS